MKGTPLNGTWNSLGRFMMFFVTGRVRSAELEESAQEALEGHRNTLGTGSLAQKWHGLITHRCRLRLWTVTTAQPSVDVS